MMKTTTKRAILIYGSNFQLGTGIYSSFNYDVEWWLSLSMLITGMFLRIWGEGFVGGPDDQ